jgi:hypothetical protein
MGSLDNESVGNAISHAYD